MPARAGGGRPGGAARDLDSAPLPRGGLRALADHESGPADRARGCGSTAAAWRTTSRAGEASTSSARSAAARPAWPCAWPRRCSRERRSLAMFSGPELLARISATYEDRSQDTYLGLLDLLGSVDFLVLEDLAIALGVNRATARAPRYRRCRRSRRTRCAGPAARRDSRRCRRPRLPPRAAWRSALMQRLVGALDRQADAGLRAARRIGGEMAEPVARPRRSGRARRHWRRCARSGPSRPPTDFAHSSAKIASSTASIDGRVDRLALEDALGQLAALESGGRPWAAAGRACSFPAARPRAGRGSARRARPRRPAPSAS